MWYSPQICANQSLVAPLIVRFGVRYNSWSMLSWANVRVMSSSMVTILCSRTTNAYKRSRKTRAPARRCHHVLSTMVPCQISRRGRPQRYHSKQPGEPQLSDRIVRVVITSDLGKPEFDTCVVLVLRCGVRYNLEGRVIYIY